MSLHGDYDANNIFAKILRGDAPCVKVFEDEDVLSFMDVFPQTRGHALVIPKATTARNFLDLPAERVSGFMAGVQLVAQAVKRALKPDGIVLTQFNGAAAGQTVFHLHFHILPRWQNAALAGHATGKMADLQQLENIATKIRQAL